MEQKVEKHLYAAELAYTTSGGQQRMFVRVGVAAHSVDDCEQEMRYLLREAKRKGLKRVEKILDHFTAIRLT